MESGRRVAKVRMPTKRSPRIVELTKQTFRLFRSAIWRSGATTLRAVTAFSIHQSQPGIIHLIRCIKLIIVLRRFEFRMNELAGQRAAKLFVDRKQFADVVFDVAGSTVYADSLISKSNLCMLRAMSRFGHRALLKARCSVMSNWFEGRFRYIKTLRERAVR